MPKPRKELISLEATPYYHCVSRCVRRAFLCGRDSEGRSFEHRRGWIEHLLIEQAKVFCIDIAAYAVMSNHFHIVLHVNQSKARKLTDLEVVQRWHQLYKGSLITQKFERGEELSEAQVAMLEDIIKLWRDRLISISWYMRRLNETVARLANDEDNCTGHFWEGRFKSQALLDEKALAACMAYVDLNPVRANVAKTPEASNYTSIQYRIRAAQVSKTPKRLMPFAGNPMKDMPQGLPFSLSDYLQLVDTTSRCIHPTKHGRVHSNLPKILERLGIESEKWLTLTTQFEHCFKHAAGKVVHLEQYAHNQHQQRVYGRKNAMRLLG